MYKNNIYYYKLSNMYPKINRGNQQSIKSLVDIRTFARKDDVLCTIGTLFAKDHIYPDSTELSKRFVNMDYTNFFKYLLLTPDGFNFWYEYIQGDLRKPYFDIEYEFKTEDRESATIKFNKIIHHVFDGIEKELHSKDVKYVQQCDCIILSSHGANKFSIHIIIHDFYFDKCSTKHTSNAYFFAKAVREHVPVELRTFIKPDSGKVCQVIDMSVYSSGREFRLIWNTKIGKDRPLIVDPLTGMEARFPRNIDDKEPLSQDLQKLRLFEACLITMTSNCKGGCLPDWVPKDLGDERNYTVIDINNEQTDLMVKMFKFSEYSNIYRINYNQTTSKNALYLTPFVKPFRCPCSGRKHTGNNAKLCYSVNGNIYLSCFGEGCGIIYLYINNGSDITNNNNSDSDDSDYEEDHREGYDPKDPGRYLGNFDMKTGTFIDNNSNISTSINPINIEQINNHDLDINNCPSLSLTSKNISGKTHIDPLVKINNDSRKTLSDKEGQFVISTNMTSIATYLHGNIKYMPGNRYSTRELFNSYENYRDGNGIKYSYDNGQFGKALASLGHLTEQVRIEGLRQRVVTLKKVDMPFLVTNPVEELNNIVNPTSIELDKDRPLNKHNDILGFIDEYLTLDPEGEVDVDNLYMCFTEYCMSKKILRKGFGVKRLMGFFTKYLVKDVDKFVIKGYRCREDKIDAKNREKELAYRRIWEYNVTPYIIGRRNGPIGYNKLNRKEWKNIQVEYVYDKNVRSIPEMVSMTKKKDPNRWCIAARSTFASGKTTILHPYIKEDYDRGQEFVKNNLDDPSMKVLIVLPRTTLTDEYMNKYRELGFEIYTDMDNVKEVRGNRLIVCFPSLHKVRTTDGKPFNLLILDEYKVIKDLQHSIVRNNGKERVSYEILRQFIKESDKIYVADALLTNAHVLEISKMRKDDVMVYQNMYRKHEGCIINTVEDKELLIHTIITKLKEGKIVSAPTNSKEFANFLNEEIKKQIPGIKISLTTADNRTRLSLNILWKGVMCMIYTPTILAGNSYTEAIDVVCAYFTPNSCDQADSMQMLMRCRNNVSKEYYVCVDTTKMSKLIPDNIEATHDKIKEYLIKKDVIVRMQQKDIPEEYRLPIDMLKFNYISEKIKEDDIYFDSYVNHIKQLVVKEREFLFRMLLYMRDCGFAYGRHIYTTTNDKQSILDIKEARKTYMKDRREAEIRNISDAPDITDEQHNYLSKSTTKTKEDINKLKKYRLKKTYKISNVPRWFVKATKSKYRQHRNISKFSEISGVIDSKERFRMMGEIGNNMLLYNTTCEEVSDNYDMVNYIEETNKSLNIKTCFHAINILNIIGYNDFLGEYNENNNIITEVKAELENYIRYNKKDIDIILMNNNELDADEIAAARNRITELLGIKFKESINNEVVVGIEGDVIKMGDKITNKAFGIKFRESKDNKIIINNMWRRNNDGVIWPLNKDANDIEELIPEIKKGDIAKKWTNEVLERLQKKNEIKPRLTTKILSINPDQGSIVRNIYQSEDRE